MRARARFATGTLRRPLVVLLALALLAELGFVTHAVLHRRSETGYLALEERLMSEPRAPSPLTTTGPGWFRSSDPLLDRIWTASVGTAQSMLSRGGLKRDALGRPCAIDVPVVILDGWVRDRCPYVGDEWVIDQTLDASQPSFVVQRNMLRWFAAHLPGGAIPSSPIFGGTLVLFDYHAYWIQALYEYALHSADLAFVREVWPNLLRLMSWYGRHTRADGLLFNDLGARDYAFIRRKGAVVAYYNAQYVLALHDACRLAGWLGDTRNEAVWRMRADAVAGRYSVAFWDPAAGAFKDTTRDSRTHPQDANAFAILAGLAGARQAASALAYLARHDTRRYGNTVSDSDEWDRPGWGSGASGRVYPFISYDEVAARFQFGLDASALDLVRREWGYMLDHGPRSTMWETIGPGGGPPVDPLHSWDAGWSSGAAPALTEYVLGVRPTSPGFATFSVHPHPGDLRWATGSVPTPHGLIRVSWRRVGARLALRVSHPPGTTWTDGRRWKWNQRSRRTGVKVRGGWRGSRPQRPLR